MIHIACLPKQPNQDEKDSLFSRLLRRVLHARTRGTGRRHRAEEITPTMPAAPGAFPAADADTAQDDHRGESRTPIIALPVATHRFPDAVVCARGNLQAVFHPQTGPDQLPCVEVAGVFVFAYLDPQTKSLRISAHLEDADGALRRPDGTVPLHITTGLGLDITDPRA